MADPRRGTSVFVLELTDPRGDGHLRVFRDREKAVRAARRWTGMAADDEASFSWWRGVGKREDYDADLYLVMVE